MLGLGFGEDLTSEQFKELLIPGLQGQSLAQQAIHDFIAGTQWTEEQLNQIRKLAQTKKWERAADPDGPLTPLPAPSPKPPIVAQKHDFISALYRPYESPI